MALDYYLSGIKIDPQHIGCIYNVGCCQFAIGRFSNAEKWFHFAIQVDPQHQESYMGLTISLLKVGKYQEALTAIETLYKMEWNCSDYL